MKAAREAFAREGFGGARIDTIAAASGVNKRMIYYYYGDKEGLFLAVLEMIYDELSDASETLELTGTPREALGQFVGFVWGYYLEHPDAIAILNNENLHRGTHLAKSTRMRGIKRPLVHKLEALLQRGAAEGVFKPNLDPVTLHITVIALVYLYIGNTPTLSIYFGRDLAADAAREAWRAHIEAMLYATVAADPSTGPAA
ncbi:TetR family transcriptional regulator [Acuticoccus sp. M5D2P5]|uniref:TetR/AcrR family transcriptional regulator n=1 Tax=Acuticoccus kalidii TaxID=2910977 RepID=UPI001F39AF85|nr:TetR/AcrR family transcriptional regulator [Acuticoccus kalidii]MCF3932701.1 TetR family transcriptional regulator [Acuticoccus kalidii]